MKIVVIGGSGLIGSKLFQVARTRTRGSCRISQFRRHTLTGEGLAEALSGASVVVDVSNSPSWEDAAVMNFFETSTRNLLNYEASAGVKTSRRIVSSLEPTGCLKAATSGQDRSGEADQKRNYPLHDRPGDAVFRIPEAACRHFFRRQEGAFAGCALPADGRR